MNEHGFIKLWPFGKVCLPIYVHTGTIVAICADERGGSQVVTAVAGLSFHVREDAAAVFNAMLAKETA